MGDAQSVTVSLSPLLERIGVLEELEGGWSLSAEEIRELLGIRPEQFLRTIYAADRSGHPLVGAAAATARFSQENIWEFVALVELFCGSRTESRLQEAGIFLTHPQQVELMGIFIAVCSRAVRARAVDSREFSAMLAVFGRFERARACYLDQHFPLEELIESAVEQYCAGRRFGIPTLARRNARGLLGYFFQKHLLDRHRLLSGVSAALFAQAVREGYAQRPRAQGGGTRAGAAAGAGGPGGADRPGSVGPTALERARGLMELGVGPLDPAVLKRQYKRLMKRYHPDVNPAGLRRCQEINAAYALLLSSA
ncbi:MAG: J domain-containing protein [Spirochaetales bacterium]|nr:J domain-containing protein [Spirochaetales bacterium]